MTPEDKKEIQTMIAEGIRNERQSIIRDTLLELPEVVGNVIQHNITKVRLNQKLYSENKDFRGKEHIVQAVLDQVDHSTPGIEYEQVIEKAIPEIRERIKNMPTLSTSYVAERPKTPYHGEI